MYIIDIYFAYQIISGMHNQVVSPKITTKSLYNVFDVHD